MKISNTLMLLGVLCTFHLECCGNSSTEFDPSKSTTVSSVSEITTTVGSDVNSDSSKSTSPNINSPENPATVPSISTKRPDNPEKIQTTPLSYAQWKEENEKRLNEKYDDKRREDQDRDNNDLLRNIQSALARPDVSAAKKAELDFVSNLLKKAALVNDPSVKKAAYDEALDVLTSVLSP